MQKKAASVRVLILGAGLMGVTSAWFLRQAGHEVTVIDRQPGPALETSKANGGQISVSHAEPWANPHVLPKILRWLGDDEAPLLFRPRLERQQWLWALAFLRECSRTRSQHNLTRLVQLGLYSRATLQALRAELQLDYDQQTRGILHVYTDAREFAAAMQPAAMMRALGCRREVIDVAQARAIEPALASVPLVGATYTPDDESGDAQRFCQQLAAHAEQAGVQFLWNTTVERLHRQGDRLTGVSVRHADGRSSLMQADAHVLCLGSHSPVYTRQVGFNLLIYPAKGYSATYHLPAGLMAPMVSLTDDAHKLVFSRLGSRLRVAGTAEFNGHGLALNPLRCAALHRRVGALFPQLAPLKPDYWAGLRPSTPSNVPYIGRSPLANLYLNTGHGTLGWTHCCGSAKLLAALLGGHAPPLLDLVQGRAGVLA